MAGDRTSQRGRECGVRPLQDVTAYGRSLGLAFETVDDLFDVTAPPEQLGKATGKDAGRGKNTYPSLMGVEGSRSEAGSNSRQP